MARLGVADRIIQVLRHRIASGFYAQGERLPTERALAAEFGVSGPTIREVTRALSAAQLIEVRHGSGAYVRTGGTAIIAMPLATMVQLENVSVLDAMELLRVLDLRAIELAVERADSNDLARCREAAGEVARSMNAEDLRFSARRFFASIGEASHEPLGASLIKFIGPLVVDLQIAAITDENADRFWRDWARNEDLHRLRFGIVEQLEARDADGARDATSAYHRELSSRIASFPAIRQQRIADLDLSRLISSLQDGS